MILLGVVSLSLTSLTLTLLLSSCNRSAIKRLVAVNTRDTTPIRVKIPGAFHGNVRLSCRSGDAVAIPVEIDNKGTGIVSDCGKDERPVIIQRELMVVNPEGAVVWSRDPNGETVGLAFRVP